MQAGDNVRALAFSALGGLALWSAIAWIGERAEPWDSGLYWSVGYPIAIAMAALLGFAFPFRAWCWAAALFLMQIPVMLAGGSGMGLLPIGLVFIALLALPAIGVATLAAGLRNRFIGS